MSLRADQDESRVADALSEIEPSSVPSMPRGMCRIGKKGYVLKSIATAALRSGDLSPRCDPARDESLEKLVESIASVGIIEPVVVRESKPGVYTVIAGERRVKAAKLLGLADVPCVVRKASDAEAMTISLTENLQRSDLDPIEKALGLKRLIEEFGLTQEEIGRRIGMSQSAIAHYLRLLTLPEEVQQLISDGSLSLGHGKVLAGIDDREEVFDVALECVSNQTSVRELETLLSGERDGHRPRASRESARRRREERELANGLFLVIKEKVTEKGTGTIEIPYYSEDEKEWVLDALAGPGTKQSASPNDKRTNGHVAARPVM